MTDEATDGTTDGNADGVTDGGAGDAADAATDGSAAAFRTKRGRCVIDGAAGTIRIEGSVAGYLRHLWRGNRAAFAVIVGMLLFVPVSLLLGDPRRWLVGLVIAGGAFGLTYGVQRFRGHTAEEEIPLAAVETVVAHPGGRLVRPRLVVRYIQDGSMKRRAIGMPSRWLSFGEEAYQTGKLAFANADVPVEER